MSNDTKALVVGLSGWGC